MNYHIWCAGHIHRRPHNYLRRPQNNLIKYKFHNNLSILLAVQTNQKKPICNKLGWDKSQTKTATAYLFLCERSVRAKEKIQKSLWILKNCLTSYKTLAHNIGIFIWQIANWCIYASSRTIEMENEFIKCTDVLFANDFVIYASLAFRPFLLICQSSCPVQLCTHKHSRPPKLISIYSWFVGTIVAGNYMINAALQLLEN